jgi:hypothetical protein
LHHFNFIRLSSVQLHLNCFSFIRLSSVQLHLNCFTSTLSDLLPTISHPIACSIKIFISSRKIQKSRIRFSSSFRQLKSFKQQTETEARNVIQRQNSRLVHVHSFHSTLFTTSTNIPSTSNDLQHQHYL